MNLEELRSVQRAERQKDSLQHLRDCFYEDVADYITQLKDERERAVAAADDPFASEDVRRLTDEIESTQEIANALYERRVGKVVKHASFAAADMATDEDGMTTEERTLFDDLVARIRENRQTVLATLEGATDRSPASDDDAADNGDLSTPTPTDEPDDGLLADALGDAPPDATDAPTTSDVPADASPAVDGTQPNDTTAAPTDDAEGEPEDGSGPADAPGVADGGRSRSTDEANFERTTLRITADVGTVYGVDDREYDLAREDVVTLPTTNAEPLVRKDAAERID